MDIAAIMFYLFYTFSILILTHDRFWDDIEELYKNRKPKWLHIIYLPCLPIVLLIVLSLYVGYLIRVFIDYLDKPINKN